MSRACPYGSCDGSGFTIDAATNTAVPCRCRPERIAAQRARMLSGAVPRRFRGVSFDRPPVTAIEPGIVRTVRRFVDDLDANLETGHGLWFMGDVGTGKTTLAMLVAQQAIDRGRSVAIFSLPRLLAEIRDTFDAGGDRPYLEFLDRLAAIDLLHIDDVGAERTSDWVLEQLYAIVNARYEEQRSIVVTTNLGPTALAEQITPRTVSRLMEICGDPLPLHGPDHRMPREDESVLPPPAPAGRLGAAVPAERTVSRQSTRAASSSR